MSSLTKSLLGITMGLGGSKGHGVVALLENARLGT